ncbi:hypothetical protein B0J12DRAFT_289078 [Macrophomina phaseolina]|uniref:Retrovirus-related Pol polyprotein from transposon TNT 1-94-like beta-barrel domain-containing protein n=1 Tax=Macrophomina phaseolina TaxID=35725 RepID=A0ABQ8GNY7_9PEZI|nr:hypothetical protein B0J12DRAFT_289078 [Macrophomina phaseolina]
MPNTEFRLNHKAWVLLSADSGYSMCNDLSRFTSLRAIKPLQTSDVSRRLKFAYAIGDVRLKIKTVGDETGELALRGVLYVPDLVYNIITGSSLVGIGAPFEEGAIDTTHGGQMISDRDKTPRVLFPSSQDKSSGLSYLQLADEYSALWPEDTPTEGRPLLLSLTVSAKGNPVFKGATFLRHDELAMTTSANGSNASDGTLSPTTEKEKFGTAALVHQLWNKHAALESEVANLRERVEKAGLEQ